MTTVVTSILAVFTAMIDWFANAMSSVSEIFYSADSGLTFVGTIAIISLAFAVTLLVIKMIRGFLQQRG